MTTRKSLLSQISLSMMNNYGLETYPLSSNFKSGSNQPLQHISSNEYNSNGSGLTSPYSIQYTQGMIKSPEKSHNTSPTYDIIDQLLTNSVDSNSKIIQRNNTDKILNLWKINESNEFAEKSKLSYNSPMITSEESNSKQQKYSIYFDYVNKKEVERISKTLKKEVIGSQFSFSQQDKEKDHPKEIKSETSIQYSKPTEIKPQLPQLNLTSKTKQQITIKELTQLNSKILLNLTEQRKESDIDQFFSPEQEIKKNSSQLEFYPMKKVRRNLKNLYSLTGFTDWVKEIYGQDWFDQEDLHPRLQRRRTQKIQIEDFFSGVQQN